MRILKRILDLSVSFVALLLLSPVMLAVAVLILLTMGRPVVFVQQRPGLAGNPFYLMKFRTMSDRRNAAGQLLPDEARLGPVGRFLRSSSLDELPQLINVLRGDMSLVGPRPLLMEYLPLYTPQQFRRHEMKPGITGLAQVNGRNSASWDQKFAFDLRYIDEWSFWLDTKILLLTAARVVTRKGVAHDGHVSMPKFNGSRD
jgi:sugar transferase EpsL